MLAGDEMVCSDEVPVLEEAVPVIVMVIVSVWVESVLEPEAWETLLLLLLDDDETIEDDGARLELDVVATELLEAAEELVVLPRLVESMIVMVEVKFDADSLAELLLPLLKVTDGRVLEAVESEAVTVIVLVRVIPVVLSTDAEVLPLGEDEIAMLVDDAETVDRVELLL